MLITENRYQHAQTPQSSFNYVTTVLFSTASNRYIVRITVCLIAKNSIAMIEGETTGLIQALASLRSFEGKARPVRKSVRP